MIIDQKLEQVDSLKYLESIITWNGSCTQVIRSRIALGKTAFSRVRILLVKRGTDIQ